MNKANDILDLSMHRHVNPKGKSPLADRAKRYMTACQTGAPKRGDTSEAEDQTQ